MIDLIRAHTSTLALIGMAAFALWVMLRWQKSHPEFDLADLITERNGKVSLKKMGVAVALGVTTWIMVTVTAQGKMTEAFLALYAGVWCGYRAYVETQKKGPPE